MILYVILICFCASVLEEDWRISLWNRKSLPGDEMLKAAGRPQSQAPSRHMKGPA
jgi:hypothetical protein